jgi:hypothetical protein
MTLTDLFTLSDEQKIEAFGRIANIYMSTTDLRELELDICRVLHSYADTKIK